MLTEIVEGLIVAASAELVWRLATRWPVYYGDSVVTTADPAWEQHGHAWTLCQQADALPESSRLPCASS